MSNPKAAAKSAKLPVSKKSSSLDQLHELTVAANASYEHYLAYIVKEVGEIDYSQPKPALTLIGSIPTIAWTCLTNDYGNFLLDHHWLSAPALSELTSKPNSVIETVLNRLKLRAIKMVNQAVNAIQETITNYQREHEAYAAELTDSCNEANSGTLIVPANLAGFLAVESMESTANANIASTEAAIQKSYEQLQDHCSRCVFNATRYCLSSALEDLSSDIALLFYFGFTEGLVPYLHIDSNLVHLKDEDIHYLSLCHDSGRIEEMCQKGQEFLKAHPYSIYPIGCFPSLKAALDAYGPIGAPSLVAGRYNGSVTQLQFRSNGTDDEADHFLAKERADLIDFAFNDERCSDPMAYYILLMISPKLYCNEHYPLFANALAELGWDPRIKDEFSPNETRRDLNNHFAHTMVGTTEQFANCNLHHYYSTPGYWRCQCGSINPHDSDHCLYCGQDEATIERYEQDPSYLIPPLAAKREAARKHEQAFGVKGSIALAAFIYNIITSVVLFFLSFGVSLRVSGYFVSYGTAHAFYDRECTFKDFVGGGAVAFGFGVFFVFVLTVTSCIFLQFVRQGSPSRKRSGIFFAIEALSILLAIVLFAVAPLHPTAAASDTTFQGDAAYFGELSFVFFFFFSILCLADIIPVLVSWIRSHLY
jgi:hypothetical protein